MTSDSENFYQKFPTFEEWSQTVYDHVDWTTRIRDLENYKNADQARYDQALEIIRRAAAIDTGAIEGLYDTDRGFTMTVAKMAATWESIAEEKGETFLKSFTAQLDVYEHLIDIVTQSVPITEKWIREVHERICKNQDHYWPHVDTPQGRKQIAVKLPKGKYKTQPNHVIAASGAKHWYAPVEDTSAEMHRLINELTSKAFQNASEELQVSYAHYAFVCIHPFADGNGRVARALASVYSYKHLHIPFLIFNDKREPYFNALARADQGQYREFIEFSIQTLAETIITFEEAFNQGDVALASLRSQSEDLRRLYITGGGYTHRQVDLAAANLLRSLKDLLVETAAGLNLSNDVITIAFSFHDVPPKSKKMMQPVDPHNRVILTASPRLIAADFKTPAPAATNFQDFIIPEVPKDCGKWDTIALKVRSKLEENLAPFELKVQMVEAMEPNSDSIKMRMKMFINRYFTYRFGRITEEGKKTLGSKGY